MTSKYAVYTKNLKVGQFATVNTKNKAIALCAYMRKIGMVPRIEKTTLTYRVWSVGSDFGTSHKILYKPMLERLKIGESLSFETQDQATACVHTAKRIGVTVKQAHVTRKLKPYLVTRIRKPQGI